MRQIAMVIASIFFLVSPAHADEARGWYELTLPDGWCVQYEHVEYRSTTGEYVITKDSLSLVFPDYAMRIRPLNAPQDNDFHFCGGTDGAGTTVPYFGYFPSMTS